MHYEKIEEVFILKIIMKWRHAGLIVGSVPQRYKRTLSHLKKNYKRPPLIWSTPMFIAYLKQIFEKNKSLKEASESLV